MGYANSVIDCYNKLIGKNQEFYVPNRKMTPFEIINLVNLCGGFVSIAHPETLKISKIELEKELLKLIKMGLCGIETFNKKIDFNNSEDFIKGYMKGLNDIYKEKDPNVEIKLLKITEVSY